jgi:hypothetical protein
VLYEAFPRDIDAGALACGLNWYARSHFRSLNDAFERPKATQRLAWTCIGQSHSLTANSFQRPGTPLSSCSPRSVNVIPEPTTRSTTVRETSTSPVPA